MESEKLDTKPPTISSSASQPSSSAADLNFPVSFGVVISCRLGDADRIRGQIEKEGGRIVYNKVSNGDLYLLTEAQVERALKGDVSALAEIHKRKQRRSVEI